MRKGKLIPRPRGERVTFSSGLIKRATKHVERLQKPLFKAISEGKLRKQIRLGMLLKKSFFNQILALWKVAQINAGKKTAGIDGMKIKLSDPRLISKIMDQLTGDTLCATPILVCEKRDAHGMISW
jgi:N-terminal domain of reverse transcriptase